MKRPGFNPWSAPTPSAHQDLGFMTQGDVAAMRRPQQAGIAAGGDTYPAMEEEQPEKSADPKGKSERFDGEWRQTPQGLKFIKTKVWYE